MKNLLEIKNWKEMINEIVQGDCLEGMKIIPNQSIDFIFCDLPYGVTANTWDMKIDFKKLWENYNRIAKDNTVIALTATQPFATDLVNSNRAWFRYEWVWNKVTHGNPLMANKRPLPVHENILIFYKK